MVQSADAFGCNRKVGCSSPRGREPLLMQIGCLPYENPERIIQTGKLVTPYPLWRNRLARSAVNRKVGGLSIPGCDSFSMK
ncbi:hypothetical protein TNIN_237181 [Trichonephila inaurata madagascariensis]|uniref:Uncharacterized protein n=1 Tax=Trichonephila inaurata madagascariensis TaxID=2747483 RepID=A0A8X7CH31_9ARAC|nr:hypothetical protein TNIN_237181 [Trichonephila inaurata madagascariensis]